MPFFDRLRSLFTREGADAKVFFEELRQRAEKDLDRREAELAETPTEAFERSKAAAQAGDDEFTRLEGAIGSRLSKAEVSALTEPATEGEDQALLDLTNFDYGDRDPLGMRAETDVTNPGAPPDKAAADKPLGANPVAAEDPDAEPRRARHTVSQDPAPVGYRRNDKAVHPPYAYGGYRSTALRAPDRALLALQHSLTEITGPIYGDRPVGPADHDLTVGHAGEPLGERIVVGGRVLDCDGRPLANQLVEVWQANAAGRYAHDADQHPAPLDANFSGGGRCVTDADGRYEFVTIRPGAYPWGNHHNAWRPAHIHFSLFGPAFATRLVTQMYFPGDPLLAYDPIFASIPEAARGALVASFDIEATRPDWALGFSWDIVLRGRDATPLGHDH